MTVDLTAQIRAIRDFALWPGAAIGAGLVQFPLVLWNGLWQLAVIGGLFVIAGLIGNCDAVRRWRFERRRVATIQHYRNEHPEVASW